MFAREALSQAAFDKLTSVADAIALGIGRKLAEAELVSTHSRLHQLLDLSPAMLYNLRIEGQGLVPTFVSGNIERLLGILPAEADSLEWWIECLHPEDRDRMMATLTTGIKEGGYTAEYRLLHRDGRYRWIVDSNRVVRDTSGEPREIAGVWTDITEHKQEQEMKQRLQVKAADAEAANRAKSAFLSAMSHEIRTPMNAILGYAQLMARDPDLGPDARKNLEIIGRSGQHLLGLINDVLDMSKIEAGRTELHPVTFNLSRLLEDMAVMFRLRAEAKSLRFEMSAGGEAVRYVVADEGKVRQVLINLLGNAVKFTQRGYVQLRVNLERRSGEQLWLSASIEDTGPGISDEEQRKLFQPFSQTRLGLTAQEGTGLGLAISRGCAQLMGGDISLSSKPGSGSVFRFEIPVTQGDAGTAMKRSVGRRVVGIRAGTPPPRILVVDDQADNRGWLSKLLTSVGFSVSEASNGEAALRNWESWRPHLILMDLHMPVMDGLEATRRIKADPCGLNTIIVALTASSMDDDRRAALQSGADGFLSKPCWEEELFEKIHTLLGVVFDYAEVNSPDNESSDGRTSINADRLRQLSRELVEELCCATAAGNKRSLDELILRVRDTDTGSALALQELADRYDYDSLTKLLEEACRR